MQFYCMVFKLPADPYINAPAIDIIGSDKVKYP
jgi:hypothetical protein